MLLPFILSTVTQPLIGAVDTAVMGRLSDPAYIAGVAVGAVIFNTLYWLLGFLRVGSTGFSAQALATGIRRPPGRPFFCRASWPCCWAPASSCAGMPSLPVPCSCCALIRPPEK